MGIHQTLIGAVWSTTLEALIDIFDKDAEIDLFLYSMYCIVTYSICHIVVCFMYRHHHFGSFMSFFVGAMGHIVAFGVKSLLFHVMVSYFSDSFKIAFAYFWLCLAISIVMVYGLASIRKRFCFAMS